MRTKDENKRHAISQAAIELVYKEGLAKTSMSKIARKAGVSPSTIYVYFENKEDMLNKIYLYAKDMFYSALLGNIDLDGPVKEITRAIFDNFHAFVKKEPVVFLFSEQFLNSPQLDYKTKEKADLMGAPIYMAIDRGIQEGVLRNVQPSLIANVVISPSMFLFKSIHDSGEKPDQETLSALFDMVWTAVKK